MKKIFYLPMALLLLSAACSMQNKANNEETASDAVTIKKELYAVMSIADTVHMGDSVMLKFTVYNGTDSTSKFLKWQTPFEPLLSKYLDIKNVDGEEAQYVGAMAKRVMPPPADAYIELAPGGSLITQFNIVQGYALTKAGTYTIHYNSESMNGLKVDKDVSFVYK